MFRSTTVQFYIIRPTYCEYIHREYHSTDNYQHMSKWLQQDYLHLTRVSTCRVTTLQTMWNSPTVCGTPLRHSACYIMLVLNTCMDANMPFTINSFRQLFPDKFFPRHFPDFLVKSMTFPWKLSNSLTFHGFRGLQTSGHPVHVKHAHCLKALLELHVLYMQNTADKIICWKVSSLIPVWTC